MYIVYVVQNTSNHKIYIGQTMDIEKRLLRHNGELKAKSSSYTSINRDTGKWIVVYTEEYNSRKEAVVREKQLKTAKGREFVKVRVRSFTVR